MLVARATTRAKARSVGVFIPCGDRLARSAPRQEAASLSLGLMALAPPTAAPIARGTRRTIKSPVRKAPSVPPPSSLVASADTSTAGHTSGLGDLPLQHKTMSGVMTT